jgi:ribosomal protein S6--L-glutamate ligase
MQLISFNIFRTLGLDASSEFSLTYIKPQDFALQPNRYQTMLQDADWVLFPEYWQLNALLYGCHSRIFPSPTTYRVGHDKIEMTRVCELLTPQHVPQTWIAANTPEEAERLWQLLAPPFVVKLPKASQGIGVWLIEEKHEWKQYLERTDRIYVQEYLPIERDLRIVWVGDEIIAAYWRHRSDSSFHTNVSRGGYVSYEDVPVQALDLVTTLAKALKINHAGFDIAMVGDHPYLLEFNRLFGNQGIVGGGRAITDAIQRYLLTCIEDDTPSDPLRPRPGDLKIAI